MRLPTPVSVLTITALLASPVWSTPRCGERCCCPTTVAIDFEHYPGPDGTLGTSDDTRPPICVGAACPIAIGNLSAEWSAVGVVFSQGTLFYSPTGWVGSGFGTYYLSAAPVKASFLVPVYGVAITSYSKWNAKLTAYDDNGRVLGISQLWHPAPGASGVFHRGTLRVCSSEPIAKIEVIEASGNSSLILNLDNLVLTTSAPCSCGE
jgi:hypothetical protein